VRQGLAQDVCTVTVSDPGSPHYRLTAITNQPPSLIRRHPFVSVQPSASVTGPVGYISGLL